MFRVHSRVPGEQQALKTWYIFKKLFWLNAYYVHVLLLLIPANVQLMYPNFHFTKEKTEHRAGGRAWLQI